MSKQYRDEIAMVCHEMMQDFYAAGGVGDAEMKQFEEGCFIDPAPVRIVSTQKALQKEREEYEYANL
jgi:uncharacterized DUF497 family protein